MIIDSEPSFVLQINQISISVSFCVWNMPSEILYNF